MERSYTAKRTKKKKTMTRSSAPPRKGERWKKTCAGLYQKKRRRYHCGRDLKGRGNKLRFFGRGGGKDLIPCRYLCRAQKRENDRLSTQKERGTEKKKKKMAFPRCKGSGSYRDRLFAGKGGEKGVLLAMVFGRRKGKRNANRHPEEAFFVIEGVEGGDVLSSIERRKKKVPILHREWEEEKGGKKGACFAAKGWIKRRKKNPPPPP